jgi:hypothetical protein
MDRAEIHRWNGRYWPILAGVCVAQATFISAPATAAQNKPEEIVVTGSRIRQNPVEVSMRAPRSSSDRCESEDEQKGIPRDEPAPHS